MSKKLNLLNPELINLIIKSPENDCFTILDAKINHNPEDKINYWYLGIAYLLQEEVESAESIWMSVLLESEDLQEDTEDLLIILQHIGQIFLNNNSLNIAQLIYEQVVNLDEEDHRNGKILGDIYLKLGNYEYAEIIFNQLISHKVVDQDIYIKYANLLMLQYRYEEIINLLKVAVKKFPQNQNIYFVLMLALTKNGQVKEAIEVAEEGLKLNPNNLLFQMENMRIMPILYEDESEIDFYQQRFTNCLNKIIDSINLVTEKNKKHALEAISLSTNFYLQYQGQQTKNLQIKYGKLVHEIMIANYPHLQDKQKKLNIQGNQLIANNKIKIGYVSSKMFNNVIGELFCGWLKYYDRNKFIVNCYYTGNKNDHITKIYENNSNKFVQIIQDLESFCQTIINDQLDVLIYLDLGMSPELTKMASLRLAPIQCKGWGPPVTSGSPVIDYFLTSDLMEISDGEKHYSETLIKLPNLAFSYSSPTLPKPLKSRHKFNLSEDNLIYWSCQSLFKYLPQYDYIFPAIASQVKKSKFVFIKFPLSDFVNQQFAKRLKKAFNQYSLNSEDYCVFINGLSEADFLNVTFLADVGLDTIGWSGGKTALEAVSCDLPVVTYPQQLMRSRHSYGILKMIEVEDTIAQSEQEYIDIAVKLGNNPEYRQEIKQKISNNKHKLFEDTECIKGLEQFLISLV